MLVTRCNYREKLKTLLVCWSHLARTQKVRAFRGMRTFDKYKENLREHNGEIWSYSTKVAEIKDDGKLHQLGWWSVTTQKHINYAAKELGLKLVK